MLAGLCEIGGGYLVWGWMREHKHFPWAELGALILAAYGVADTAYTGPTSTSDSSSTVAEKRIFSPL